jgi:antirestriction protein ArdC
MGAKTMTPQALSKILADVAQSADAAAYIDMHLDLCRKDFRAAFQRASTADAARRAGDDKTADFFEEWANAANERGEKHLTLAVAAQRGVTL